MAMTSHMAHAPMYTTSPSQHTHHTRLESLADEEADKLARGIDAGPGELESLALNSMSRQQLQNRQQRRSSSSSSLSRMSSRPSYEQIALGHGSGSGASTPSPGIPVAAIGKVNVTDPWGTAWGMDSPYDNALAYSSNPNRLTIRQSAYFGSNITLAALAAAEAGAGAGAGPLLGSSGHQHLHPHQAGASSSLSNISSSASGGSASTSSNNNNNNSSNAWSEVSSISSVGNGIPPSAPWVSSHPSSSGTDRHGKRRSVSFQGDIAGLLQQQQQQQQQQYSPGRMSPSAVSMHEYRHQHHYNHPSHHPHAHHRPSSPHHPDTGMRTRSTTHLPSLLGQGQGQSNINGNHPHHATVMPANRRALSTPGTEADRSSFRKSFIGGSVIYQSHAASELPPVPVDPKKLAKQNKRVSKHPIANDKSDTLSVLSATESTTSKSGFSSSRRKSWFSRSPSSMSVESPTSPSTATFPSTTSTSTSRSSLSGIGLRKASGDSIRPSPTLARSPHSFGSDPPPPTPPLPDTLPIPPSLGDRGRKASTSSLQQARINGSSGASTPSSLANVELPPVDEGSAPTPPHLSGDEKQAQEQPSGGASLITTAPNIPLPATPHSARHTQKALSSPSTIYGTPLASPTHTHVPTSSASTITYGLPMPPTSSPLSMSPMTSPTSASTMPLKPAASARSSAMQLPTHEEQPMLPEMSPSPHTHMRNMQAASEAYGMRDVAAQGNSTDMVRSASDNGIAGMGTFGESASQMHHARASLSVPSSPQSGYALAPAAVIRASPSSPASLNLASLTDAHADRSRSPSASPGGSRSRHRSPLSTRGDGNERPGTAPAATQSPSSSSRPYVAPRSASYGSQSQTSSTGPDVLSGRLEQEVPSQSSSSSVASRKASSSSLRAAMQHVPPMPEPSSAVIETTVPFQPPPRSQSSQSRTRSQSHSNGSIAAEAKESMILVPHQPDLNTSLSSFNPRKVSPAPSVSSSQHLPTGLSSMPRKVSERSLHAEAFPLPDSPQLSAAGFESQQNLPRSDTNLAVAPELKPRASSPNLRGPFSAPVSDRSMPGSLGNGLPAKINKVAPPSRKSSKSPFSFLRRTRSKTVGEDSLPSRLQAQPRAPPPPMPSQPQPQSQSSSSSPLRKDSLASVSVQAQASIPASASSVVTAAVSQPTSAQMTPASTPQLSFSSSTTSTMAGSEPSDQFYADFTPASRPSFSAAIPSSDRSHAHTSMQTDNKAAQKSAGDRRTDQPAPVSNAGTKGTIRRLFGASTRRN